MPVRLRLYELVHACDRQYVLVQDCDWLAVGPSCLTPPASCEMIGTSGAAPPAFVIANGCVYCVAQVHQGPSHSHAPASGFLSQSRGRRRRRTLPRRRRRPWRRLTASETRTPPTSLLTWQPRPSRRPRRRPEHQALPPPTPQTRPLPATRFPPLQIRRLIGIQVLRLRMKVVPQSLRQGRQQRQAVQRSSRPLLMRRHRKAWRLWAGKRQLGAHRAPPSSRGVLPCRRGIPGTSPAAQVAAMVRCPSALRMRQGQTAPRRLIRLRSRAKIRAQLASRRGQPPKRPAQSLLPPGLPPTPALHLLSWVQLRHPVQRQNWQARAINRWPRQRQPSKQMKLR